MTPDPDEIARAVADAEATIAGLDAQISRMRTTLARLTQDVADAEARLDQNRSALLVDTNERLVLAALNSRAEAVAATQALSQAAHSARHDRLTGLANRTALLDRFERAAARARRRGNRVALLFIDLDGFKALNDTHGHHFGDDVLRLVSGRLVGVVREVDSIGRYGGDEFLVLLPDVTDVADARTVAAKLEAAVAVPMEVAGRTVTLTASVGMAVFPDDGESTDVLLAKADEAMYAAKRQRHLSAGARGSRA